MRSPSPLFFFVGGPFWCHWLPADYWCRFPLVGLLGIYRVILNSDQKLLVNIESVKKIGLWRKDKLLGGWSVHSILFGFVIPKNPNLWVFEVLDAFFSNFFVAHYVESIVLRSMVMVLFHLPRLRKRQPSLSIKLFRRLRCCKCIQSALASS